MSRPGATLPRMVEEERKYDADTRFSLPDLKDCLPKGGRVLTLAPITMRAIYFDTHDLRLARAGVSLRHRSSGGLATDREPADDEPEQPWTVKLPTDVPGTRHEINRPPTSTTGPRTAASIPPDLVSLVTVYTRGAALAPVATLRITRTRHELLSEDGEQLAEIADDAVSVLDDRKVRAKFREIEVERFSAKRKLLRRVGDALCAAGAVEGTFTPKHVRALGEAALAPADLVPPADWLDKRASAGDVVTAVIRGDIGRVLTHDPLVRLRADVGKGDTAVHQMRVGVRRLRSALRTFAPLCVEGWAAPLREELRWLADVLGGAREAEVLRARLQRTARTDPVAGLDDASVARIDAELAARHEEALIALDEALESPRYLTLINTLVAIAAVPLLTPIADRKARTLLPRLVDRAWQRLSYGKHGLDGAGDLDKTTTDREWHAVRIRAKRARYAAEGTTLVLGEPARAFAAALADVVDVLGAHQDAVVAAQTWLAIAASDPDDHALAVTAGRLVERERATARSARDCYPGMWKAVERDTLTAWLQPS